MKKLLTILPFTLSLCGCSAFAPVVLENNTIAQSQNVSFVTPPKRAVASNVGAYSLTLDSEEPTGSTFIKISTPTIGEQEMRFSAWDTNFTISNSFLECVASMSRDGTGNYSADVLLRLKCGEAPLEVQRLSEAYYYLQADQSYILGSGWDINEFNQEYWPEISLFVDWTGGSHVITTATFNLPMVNAVVTETFGTIEFSGNYWGKQNEVFSKTFNAIYEDNTEPKLYAFWIDRYMLARQVRLNGDIINQNYVTAMDGLDPSFGKQCRVSFTLTEDVYLKVSATPYDPSWDLVNDYNRGYTDGKAEGEKPVSWFKNIFDGMASFFSVEIIPHLSLGLIVFAPLLVLAIIVIVRIFKHGG